MACGQARTGTDRHGHVGWRRASPSRVGPPSRPPDRRHAMSGADGASTPGFGALLRRYRLEAGLSQEELAERAGMSSKAIGALERGDRQRPYPATVRRLADALGLAGEAHVALLATVPPRGPARERQAEATAEAPAEATVEGVISGPQAAEPDTA